MVMSNEAQLIGMYTTVILMGLVLIAYSKFDERRKAKAANKDKVS